MDPIEQDLNDYIVQEIMTDSPNPHLSNDDLLIEDGIIDSLGIFTLIAFIEPRFGVKIQPEDVLLDNFRTVRTIRALVVMRQQDAPTHETNGTCPARQSDNSGEKRNGELTLR
jgi:acyl carrier protein